MGNFIEVRVEDANFLGWLRQVENSFVNMTETMIRVAKLIKEEVQTEYVPIDTGRLSRSYRWTILTDNSRMKLLQVKMSALNPKTGYDYAWIQHDNLSYNHGYQDIGFFHYHYDKWDDEYDESRSGAEYGANHTHRGTSKYLYWAIRDSRDSSYEMIETDYLSLFTGGFIV